MSRPTHEAIPLGIFSAFITVENLLVCFVLFRHQTLLHSFINRFVVSLAFADLLYGSVLLPLTIADLHNRSVVPYLTALILLVNISNVFAMTLDRYWAVVKPMEYVLLMKPHFVKITIAVWLCPIVVSVLPLAWKADRSHIAHTVYIICLLVLGIFIPYVLIMAAYVCILRAVRRHVRGLARLDRYERTSEEEQKGKQLTAEAYVARVFAVVAVIFLISWMPVIFVSAANVVGKLSIVPRSLYIVSWYTLSLGCMLHAPIYAFMKADINTALKEMCGLGQSRQSNSEEGTTFYTL